MYAVKTHRQQLSLKASRTYNESMRKTNDHSAFQEPYRAIFVYALAVKFRHIFTLLGVLTLT